MKTLPTDIVISAGCINEEDIASSYSKAYMNGQRALNGFIWGILEVAAVFSPMESELLSRHNFRDGIVESGWEKEDDPRR